jgi:hypothetical protein
MGKNMMQFYKTFNLIELSWTHFVRRTVMKQWIG